MISIASLWLEQFDKSSIFAVLLSAKPDYPLGLTEIIAKIIPDTQTPIFVWGKPEVSAIPNMLWITGNVTFNNPSTTDPLPIWGLGIVTPFPPTELLEWIAFDATIPSAIPPTSTLTIPWRLLTQIDPG